MMAVARIRQEKSLQLQQLHCPAGCMARTLPAAADHDKPAADHPTQFTREENQPGRRRVFSGKVKEIDPKNISIFKRPALGGYRLAVRSDARRHRRWCDHPGNALSGSLAAVCMLESDTSKSWAAKGTPWGRQRGETGPKAVSSHW